MSSRSSLLSSRDVAERLGLPLFQVQRLAIEGELRASRGANGRYVFKEEDVQRFELEMHQPENEAEDEPEEVQLQEAPRRARVREEGMTSWEREVQEARAKTEIEKERLERERLVREDVELRWRKAREEQDARSREQAARIEEMTTKINRDRVEARRTQLRQFGRFEAVVRMNREDWDEADKLDALGEVDEVLQEVKADWTDAQVSRAVRDVLAGWE